MNPFVATYAVRCEASIEGKVEQGLDLGGSVVTRQAGWSFPRRREHPWGGTNSRKHLFVPEALYPVADLHRRSRRRSDRRRTFPPCLYLVCAPRAPREEVGPVVLRDRLQRGVQGSTTDPPLACPLSSRIVPDRAYDGFRASTRSAVAPTPVSTRAKLVPGSWPKATPARS